MIIVGVLVHLNRHTPEMSQEGDRTLVNAIPPEFLPKLDPQFVEIYNKNQGQNCGASDGLAKLSAHVRPRYTLMLTWIAKT